MSRVYLLLLIRCAKITPMKRTWLIVGAIVLGLGLIGLVVKAKFFSKEGPGALQISSTPKGTVFLNGTQVGITPYFDDEIEAGEYTVKLVPEATQDDLVSWEGKVQVTSNILTVINRELASDESSSSGEILSLEKIGKKDLSSLSVVSVPDQAVVKINGEPKGFAPVLVEDLTPGDYQVVISAPGYQERTVSAHTVAGYKLTVNVKLAQSVEGIEEEEAVKGEGEEEGEEGEEVATPTPKPSPGPDVTPPDKPYIKVKDTPTGWLRVRMEPSISSTEAARINPGEMYPYLDEEESGWYKIEYKEGEEGWVSGTYVELVE